MSPMPAHPDPAVTVLRASDLGRFWLKVEKNYVRLARAFSISPKRVSMIAANKAWIEEGT